MALAALVLRGLYVADYPAMSSRSFVDRHLLRYGAWLPVDRADSAVITHNANHQMCRRW